MSLSLALVSVSFLRRVVSAGVGVGLAALSAATTVAAQTAAPLPPAVEAALARAKVPREAVSLLVLPAQGTGAPRLAHRAQEPMNPASVMKLVTTFAGLELLGPAYVWQTPVYIDGTVHDGTLRGNVYLRGQGDPKLVMERLWLLLRRLQGQGIEDIHGDIVLDRSAFSVPGHDAAQFDGEPLRPYNAAPDALLLNFKSVVMGWVPDTAAGVARVQWDPPLAGVRLPRSVPLAPAGTACGDWRASLKAELANPTRFTFAGAYPSSCGERQWAIAYADPGAYAARAIAGMWGHMGGTLTGTVRNGTVPAGLSPIFSSSSPALAEVVRDINKYSNNVMVQQLFLTFSLQQNGLGSMDASRAVLQQWWRKRFGELEMPIVDNGAGLSREARISAQSLARMLQAAWAAPVMPELVASLPVVGVDGTLRRSQSSATGSAHLKTGSLRDVSAVAGYVHAADGQRYVLAAMINHANAQVARPALDALIDWTARLPGAVQK